MQLRYLSIIIIPALPLPLPPAVSSPRAYQLLINIKAELFLITNFGDLLDLIANWQSFVDDFTVLVDHVEVFDAES